MTDFHNVLFAMPFATAVVFLIIWGLEWKKLPKAVKAFYLPGAFIAVLLFFLMIHSCDIKTGYFHFFVIDVFGLSAVFFTFPAIIRYYRSLCSKTVRPDVFNTVVMVAAAIFFFFNLLYGILSEPDNIEGYMADAHQADDQMLHYNIFEWDMYHNSDVASIAMLVLSLLTVVALVRLVRKYGIRMHNFYADESGHDLKLIAGISVFLVLLLAYFWFLGMVSREIITICYCVSSIVGFVGFVLTFSVFYTAGKITRAVRDIHVPDAREPVNNVSSTAIETILDNWVNDSSKPYLKSGITLDDVAASTGIERSLISKYLNSILKVNFNEWVNGLRIGEAKRMLQSDSNRSILDIALSCGYTDQSVFSRAFRRFAGTTPTAFQKASR